MSEFKAVDFHIHTLHTISDNKFFVFDKERLRRYISKLKLKAIAITNHNLFDREQFEEITEYLSNEDVIVFPGVEIDLESAHILVIAPQDSRDSFSEVCSKISAKVTSQDFTLKIEEFNELFNDLLDKCLLIPHYKKTPAMSASVISKISANIIVGEVQNPKKFELMKKDDSEHLCPVMFSDIRMGTLLNSEPEPAPKITYIEIDDITIPKLKIALSDKRHVALTKTGEDKFIIDSNLTSASLGLNVVLGKRSSGKTYLLNGIANIYGNDDTLYVKQFEIVDRCTDDNFKDMIDAQFKIITEKYLSGIKHLVEVVLNTKNEKSSLMDIEKYLSSLKNYAKDTAVRDTYAKTKLFNESEFTNVEDQIGETILNNIGFLIDNANYSKILSGNITTLKHIYLDVLKEHRNRALSNKLKEYVNSIISSTKKLLAAKSSSRPILSPDLYNSIKSIVVNRRFDELITKLRKPSKIERLGTAFGRFNIEVTKRLFDNVSDLQKHLGFDKPRAEIFNSYYKTPHKFVKELNDISAFSKPEFIYKTLVKVEVKPIKNDGGNISKGERAEYVLMKRLMEAKNYRLFLFDEPEPSFDNPFIGEEVIGQLKDLAEDTTVFVVTHNNTIGASMNPDCLLYTEQSDNEYRTYIGSLTSEKMETSDGRSVRTSDTIISTLESSSKHYNQRRELYGNIKN
jgi:PHP N-domain protein